MIYRDYKGMKVPMMAVGCMRLPVIDGNDGNINVLEAERIIDAAYAAGINYFDTAWGYHMGNSETVVGQALKKYPRESFMLSTKFPGYDLGNFGKHEEIFEKQLEKCQTDYFDFYFIHNVCELNIEKYLDEETYHTVAYFVEQRRKGRIRHLGFSAHGSMEVMKRFLERFGEYMEFGMIQLNYLDYNFQNARAKLDLLNSLNIPVWVMEPLRGGMLARMSPGDLEKMQKFRPGVQPVEWCFRFLQSLPGVVTVLSGMTDMDQMKEKLAAFEEERPLNGDEREALVAIGKKLTDSQTVPCTACKYCLSHCPKGLNIPELLEKYNEFTVTNGGFIAPMTIMSYPKDKRPSACIGCRSCEKVCPQQIRISEIMKPFGTKIDQTIKDVFGQE